MSKFNKIVFSSKTYKHNTPKELFDELDSEFHFTFDPNHPPIVGDFWGNGLREKWSGRVYANFPYKRGLLMRWVQRAWTQLVQGNCDLVVMLLPSRTGSPWFTYLIKKGAEFRPIEGRLQFDGAEWDAPFDSIVAILTQKNVEEWKNRQTY